VHTSIEHSRDWCRSLLILNCQELAAQQPLRPINWCSRLLKMTINLAVKMFNKSPFDEHFLAAKQKGRPTSHPFDRCMHLKKCPQIRRKLVALLVTGIDTLSPARARKTSSLGIRSNARTPSNERFHHSGYFSFGLNARRISRPVHKSGHFRSDVQLC
ncbi:hypothetical protein, partial [Pseudomonas aeruginosa]|uniref:hypothetical protein n=1 Tax=Pseudomonas aeruginosa TaxID=287 RepID=UPI003FA6FC1D